MGSLQRQGGGLLGIPGHSWGCSPRFRGLPVVSRGFPVFFPEPPVFSHGRPCVCLLFCVFLRLVKKSPFFRMSRVKRKKNTPKQRQKNAKTTPTITPNNAKENAQKTPNEK